MSPSAHEYLLHILDEIAYLRQESDGLSKSDFVSDETLKRAFVRSLEVIGEAVKHLPESLRQRYPSIDWRAIAGMRDRLIHNYFGVDYDIVWDAVINKLPALQEAIHYILQQNDEERQR
ncbi:MAG: DUF86 domain-containing protein [Cyanobacteria bacterium J06627_8]